MIFSSSSELNFAKMNAGRPALRVRGFAVDQAEEIFSQVQRRDKERRVLRSLGISRQIVEDVVHGVSEMRVAGEQAQVGIEARGRGIVIARAEMGVAANLAVGFAPRDKRQLAMRFQADHAVEHLHACFLQIARPANVRGFVEARLQLDDNRDFFFRRGFDQRAHDRRILAGAIERLLDREHIGILRGAFDEPHDRRVGIVGMVQQHVALADEFKQRRRAGLQMPARAARTHGISDPGAESGRRDEKAAKD